MNKSRLFIATVATLVLLFSQLGFASSDEPSNSTRTLANIMNYLNHYPAPPEKRKLDKIIADADATPHEKTIARAMKEMQHSVSDSDKQALAKIVADSSAPQSIRDLAGVLQNLNHKPSAADKSILKKYMW
ncbi:MAG: hypothetical protein OEX19_14900 [Gammaproteobacteria bacterium]|nr:hypothetical protein [Gammaproteobacteria bacterium]